MPEEVKKNINKEVKPKNAREPHKSKKKKIGILIIIAICIASVSLIGYFFFFESEESTEKAEDETLSWTESFNIEALNFSSTGNNTYFILQIDYQLVLEGVEDGDDIRLVITVLNETEMVGGIETRVVVENETVNGEVVEVSRNYFAICNQTNSVFYFGEAVDIYENGIIVDHSGAWRADEGENVAGIAMPGTILIGARYYQEIAPDIAMDRAEILSNDNTFETPAGEFENCLITEESTPLEPLAIEYKFYAPGIGLIADEMLVLTQYGYI